MNETERLEQRTRRAEEYFLKLKTVDELQDILADRYGVTPPSEKWFCRKREKYKQGLIDLILKCKFG